MTNKAISMPSRAAQSLPVMTPDAPGWAASRTAAVVEARSGCGQPGQTPRSGTRGSKTILGLPQGNQLLFD